KQSLAAIKRPEKAAIKITEGDDEIVLSSRGLTVSLNKSSGRLLFRNADGTLLLDEKEQGKFNVCDDAGTKTYSVSQTFILEKEEPIYGLGILQNGKMSQRNQQVRMVQNNTWDFVPFFQSVKGYGVYWDNYSPTNFNAKQDGTTFFSEVGE